MDDGRDIDWRAIPTWYRRWWALPAWHKALWLLSRGAVMAVAYAGVAAAVL